MDVRFVTSDLRRFDEIRADAIALPLFLGEKPLRGALSLVDWRLCGRLSTAVQGGRLSGAMGEHLLVAGRPKLGCDKLFVYGVGERESFDDRTFMSAVRGLFDALARARVRSTVCLLPGREAGLVTPPRAMEIFLTMMGEDPEHHDEVTLIEDVEAQKDMVRVVDQARRRARARRLD